MKGLRFYDCQSIARHLSVRDLCRAMQVCREWFALWVDDRMWIVHEQRIFSRHPELRDLLHRATEATKKRHRRFLIVPHKGTWWFFKQIVNFEFSFEGFKRLCDTPKLHPLAMAVGKSMIPRHSYKYAKVSVNTEPRSAVYLEFIDGRTISVVSEEGCIIFACYNKDLTWHNDFCGCAVEFYFKNWKAFVLESKEKEFNRSEGLVSFVIG